MAAYLEKLKAAIGMGHLAKVKTHVENTAHAARAVGEGVVVGGLLGYADSHMKTGLDYQATVPAKAPAAGQPATAPKTVNIPTDAALGGLALVTSLALSGHPDGLQHDARNVANSALSIFTYRKTRDYTAKQQRINGQVPGYQNTPNFAATVGVGTTPPAAAHGDNESYGRRFGFHGEGGTDGQDPILALASSF